MCFYVKLRLACIKGRVGTSINKETTIVCRAGFWSKSKYMFGKFNIQIKLVEGDFAGTVTAFYVS
ncbi:Concanavalin A-like lectin/glucanase superfamily [Cynara cardunculus var. scolymus]|uniref:Concanavalin A-like lectin/glucanase superfamily n=1 Tax=Cynara cardunculus var. scolymus TaxID=59895 RepID=A0A103YLS2_CYNCS|nr:Concanavalin A-like lectin/glucanase superfamily [Cynara cardunculus var. scolymus]